MDLACTVPLNSTLLSVEVPFALPPKRFEDPEPLPSSGYQYEDKEYVYESSCMLRSLSILRTPTDPHKMVCSR